jgi:hypothetical protein
VKDRAQIFTELTKRNALRREAGLPLLKLRAEVEHEVALERWREWEAVCEAHADLRAEISERIRAEYRAKGRTLQSASGRALLDLKTEAAFVDEMAKRGHRRPKLPSRNPITYAKPA